MEKMKTFPVKKKSRNCIEKVTLSPIFVPVGHHPRNSVWFLNASSRKSLYYNIPWQIQFNLHFQCELRSPCATRRTEKCQAGDQPFQEQGHKKHDPFIFPPSICKKQTKQRDQSEICSIIQFCGSSPSTSEMDNFPPMSQLNHLQTSSVKLLLWLKYI